jgi:hypothetical protein
VKVDRRGQNSSVRGVDDGGAGQTLPKNRQLAVGRLGELNCHGRFDNTLSREAAGGASCDFRGGEVWTKLATRSCVVIAWTPSAAIRAFLWIGRSNERSFQRILSEEVAAHFQESSRRFFRMGRTAVFGWVERLRRRQ